MKNYVAEGKIIRLTVGSGVVAGDPVVVGSIAGVAMTDYDSVDGKAEVRVAGVHSLSVTGEDGAGNAAIAEGDKVYLDSGVVNADDTNGDLFGKALAAVSSGATATIEVLLIQA